MKLNWTTYNFLSSDDQHNIKMSTVLYTGEKVKFYDLVIENLKAFELLKPQHIIDILNDEEINISSFDYKDLNGQIVFNWKNLNQKVIND